MESQRTNNNNQLFNILERNVNNIKAEIRECARKVNKNESDIILLPATKYIGQEELLMLYNLGFRDFGENRVQDVLTKKKFLPDDTRWHMIGHLQSNKVSKAVRIFETIQSVDSIKIAESIDKFCSLYSVKKEVMIEVNVSNEASKFGFDTETIIDKIHGLSSLKNIKIVGLMAMTPMTDDKEKSRPYFRKMNELFNKIRQVQSGCVELKFLSMGMSQDYTVAIEEGANLIRIGRALFDGILCPS